MATPACRLICKFLQFRSVNQSQLTQGGFHQIIEGSEKYRNKIVHFPYSSIANFCKTPPTIRKGILVIERSKWISMLLAATAYTSAPIAVANAGEGPALPPIEERAPEDEIIYFVLPDRFENAEASNDRGGIEGGRLDHGFDPTHKGFYQGGDLKGLTKRLDYIQGLGATAIWLTPIFKNKPVQGPNGNESSGYHGYWITDFLDVDPHLGTREDFKNLVEAAHARGMKVYMDIIANHTADVIKYAECHGPEAPAMYRESFTCPFRSEGDYPYTSLGRAEGSSINEGFLGSKASNAGKLRQADQPQLRIYPLY